MMRLGWGWALAQGMRTCPEYWNNRSSLCHAWSSTPTYFLSRYALGVHYPEAANLKKVAIRVQTESITSADGAFPHPSGAVEVKWHMEKGTRVFDRVKAPRGVKVVSVR
jgi:alpha-L-rhamnosidase